MKVDTRLVVVTLQEEINNMQRLFNIFLLLLVFSSTNIVVNNKQNILKPYSKELFNKAKNDKSPIVLHFHADWCGICHRQMKLLNQLLAQGQYGKIVALQADYDTKTRSKEEAELIQQLKISGRSTIIYMKDGKVVYEISSRKNPKSIVDEKSIKNGLDMLAGKKTGG